MIENFLTWKVNDYYVAIIFWNIFLALIPCLIAWRLSTVYYLKKWGNISQMNRLLFGITFLIWFFFFPNAAYLIADIRHLVGYCEVLDFYRSCPAQAWVVPLFFTYALVGIPTFYYALKKMSLVIEKLFGKMARRIFPLLMIPITAMGLMLGLVARFNSWEIVYKPLSILKIAWQYVNSEIMVINILAYTLMLYLVYYGIDFLWKKRK